MNILNAFLVSAGAFLLAFEGRSGVPQLPVQQSSRIASISAGASPEIRFKYDCVLFDRSDSEFEYYRVECALIPTNSAVPLSATSERIAFRQGETVGLERPPFLDAGGSSNLGLTAFDQSRLRIDVEVLYFDVFVNAPTNTFYYRARGLTNVFVGYRFPDEDGVHYGWVQFARSDTGFTNIFDLVAHDWHPIPGAAIRAGAPPEVPLMTEVVDDGSGGSLLRTSWHPSVATWQFETTDSLIPPVTWVEYPAGGTFAEIPLDGAESHRYFRLRRP